VPRCQWQRIYMPQAGNLGHEQYLCLFPAASIEM